ncbi:hypothetical protein F4560_008285 [Saccharothrix ecbatanensis]|uniref:Uncharacterized protein n=1 Tax=Saccharothrix ecbatanensis TaxID=1105145 RepID=A0A7W9HU22_9PSEU|nr:hypothetical protein [Saccharothrix ecbatanensis]MBB5808517.1 hypothetical protein [Saccharothrix ecbatanensis]
MMQPAYLEPRTDVPAVDDWSTKLFLDEDKAFAHVNDAMAVGSLTVAVSLVVFPETTPGTVAAVVVLALLGLNAALAALVHRHERAPRRRGLLDRPWRRVPATVAAGGTWDEDRLILFTEDGTVVLRGSLPDVPLQVLDRQEVFLCGPDDEGRAVVRVAGLCTLFPMRVDAEADEVRPREREPHLIGRPLDDPVVARAFRGFRWGARAWVWPTGAAVIGAAVVSLSLSPLAPAGLVVGGLLIVAAAILSPGVALIGGLYRQAVAAAEAATKWTPVPVTLFPWEEEHEVAGLAQLPTGTAVVRFPLPDRDLIANIAETGTMWMAGEGSGVVTVGLPRVHALMVVMVERDRDVPEENPQPWLRRVFEPSWDGVPTLRG